jgi:hypothetical protein
MRGAIPSLPQYAFVTWCSAIKHRDNFTFTFLTYVVLCHHGMARPRIADGGDGPQIWMLPGVY